MRQNKVNMFIALCYTLITIITAILKQDFSFLLSLLYIPIPFIIKLPNLMTTIYLLYGFVCVYLGNSMHLFKKTIWLDTTTHILWGFLSGIVAIYILDKFKMWNSKNILFNVFFIFIFSLASSGLWEIIEFTVDNLFNMDTQRRASGIFDTMKDIIVTLLGNIVFIIWFYYEYKKKQKLIIHKIIEAIDVSN